MCLRLAADTTPRLGNLARRCNGISIVGAASRQRRAFNTAHFSLPELPHVPLPPAPCPAASEVWPTDRPRRGTAVETDAASRAAMPAVMGRMHTKGAEFLQQLQALGR